MSSSGELQIWMCSDVSLYYSSPDDKKRQSSAEGEKHNAARCHRGTVTVVDKKTAILYAPGVNERVGKFTAWFSSRVMAVKEWFRRFQPVQLYLVMFFTMAFFLVEIIASYITHSLTLLLNAYHMLCNIIALAGCIASIKYSHHESRSTSSSNSNSLGNSSICINGDDRGSTLSVSTKTKQSRSDRRMKNTFGWARIDILTMLACCVFLASFCFSLVVEAAQTLVHIDHMDAMHHPLPVLCIGASGILLNAFCYLLIGGYTFNQGIFLHVTTDGDVILRRNLNSGQAKDGEQQQTRSSPLAIPKTQGLRDMCRDVLGCVFVIIVSILVYFDNFHVAKFIDPVFAIIASVCLFVMSYPYMKESGLILLQTIPNHINIDSLKRELLEAFPGIVNVHDLHVWQLTSERIISTVHIIFLDPTVYASITDQVTAFFVEMGITQVTIQPEFHKMKPTGLGKADCECLIRCRGKYCSSSQCCSKEKYAEDSCTDVLVKHPHTINKRLEKKEIIPASLEMDLKRFVVHDSDGPHVHGCKDDLIDRETCRPNVKQVENKRDNVTDSSSYAISVDVNDQKCAVDDNPLENNTVSRLSSCRADE